MTGYQGQDFSKEFTERTMKVFEQKHTFHTEFEVTVLVNLALGLIVIPAEYLNSKNRTNRRFSESFLKLTELKEVIKKELDFSNDSFHITDNGYNSKGNTLNDLNYFEFLRLVRNGLSHGLVDFIGDPIEKIQISNRKHNGKENFRIIISIEEFKYVMKKIASLHLELVEFQQNEKG